MLLIKNGYVKPIAGKDGDVVIWDSDPLTAVGAAPLFTIIEGKIVYQAE